MPQIPERLSLSQKLSECESLLQQKNEEVTKLTDNVELLIGLLKKAKEEREMHLDQLKGLKADVKERDIVIEDSKLRSKLEEQAFKRIMSKERETYEKKIYKSKVNIDKKDAILKKWTEAAILSSFQHNDPTLSSLIEATCGLLPSARDVAVETYKANLDKKPIPAATMPPSSSSSPKKGKGKSVDGRVETPSSEIEEGERDNEKEIEKDKESKKSSKPLSSSPSPSPPSKGAGRKSVSVSRGRGSGSGKGSPSVVNSSSSSSSNSNNSDSNNNNNTKKHDDVNENGDGDGDDNAGEGERENTDRPLENQSISE